MAKKTKKTLTKAQNKGQFDKGFIDNDHLSSLTPKDKDKAPDKAIDKLMSGAKKGDNAISKALAGKAKDLDKVQGDLKTQPTIVDWFKDSYDNVVIVNRANGIVYNALVGSSHKKVVKVPTFENKGGLFYGGLLNSVMQPLAKSGLTVHHSKSNVYKTTKSTLTRTQAIDLRQAIVKVIGAPKLPVDKFVG